MGLFDFFRKNRKNDYRGDTDYNFDDDYDYDDDDYEDEGLSLSDIADIFASSGEDEDYDFGYDHDDLRGYYKDDYDDYDDYDKDTVIDWYCDNCDSYLFTQRGKSYRSTYRCPKCGYINDVSKNNIF